MNILYRDLYAVWIQQLQYNDNVKMLKEGNDIDWMVDYILGTMSELGELLQEMNWKKHRLHSVEDFGPNISEELADITKYVFSMWQLAGFTSDDMLNAVYRKGEILDQLYWQELIEPYLEKKIIMLDLDGVVANFRAGFSEWVEDSKWAGILNLGETNFGLHIDLDNHWEYATYEEAKLEFERQGGYGTLPPIPRVLDAVRQLAEDDFQIVVWTARPHHVYKRIRSDTWSWLVQNGVPAASLHFGSDERVRAAAKLVKNNFVIAFEDNPTLAKRYAVSGVPVVLISQPYNEGILDPRVSRIKDREYSQDIVGLVTEIASYRERKQHA